MGNLLSRLSHAIYTHVFISALSVRTPLSLFNWKTVVNPVRNGRSSYEPLVHNYLLCIGTARASYMLDICTMREQTNF